MSKKVLGITGAIGAGKSFAAQCFARAGWRTVDADRLCHELYADPGSPFTQAVAVHFGESVLDGSGAVDRKRLGERVFASSEALAELTGLLYPALTERLNEEIAAARQTGEKLLLEIPLLFEAALKLDLDGTVAVWAERSVRFRRLKEWRCYSDEEIRRRESHQFSADEKLERADYALINHGRPAFLEQQIECLFTILEEEK